MPYPRGIFPPLQSADVHWSAMIDFAAVAKFPHLGTEAAGENLKIPPCRHKVASFPSSPAAVGKGLREGVIKPKEVAAGQTGTLRV